MREGGASRSSCWTGACDTSAHAKRGRSGRAIPSDGAPIAHLRRRSVPCAYTAAYVIPLRCPSVATFPAAISFFMTGRIVPESVAMAAAISSPR